MTRVASLCACVFVGCGVPATQLDPGGNPIAAAPKPDQRALLSVPALTGGTLLVTRDHLAVAADPENDLVWVADLSSGRVRGWLTLKVGDEPGRLIEDSHGLVHVALRRGGALVTFDPNASKLEVLHRRDVCAEPRGVALDSQTASVVVACTGGELVWLPETGEAATTRLQADPDLRDVIVDGDKLSITTFRSAELITLNRAGTVMKRSTPPRASARIGTLAPAVAWRTIPLRDGKVAIVHHRAKQEAITLSTSTSTTPPPPGSTSTSPYGGAGSGFTCPESIVDSAITIMGPNATDTRQGQLTSGSLPIDVAVDSTGFMIGVVTASPGKVSVVLAANLIEQPTLGQCTPAEREVMTEGEPIAVAWNGNVLVAQTRSPAGLRATDGRVINFPVAERTDRGFTLFHQQAGAPLACASCHPEGRDDGRTWHFNPGGTRRTQSLNVGILRTSPFHWDGSLPDLNALMTDVFVKRMGGRMPSNEDVGSLASWLDTLPASKPHAADAAAVERGRALFEAPATKCASCHLGARFTNNTTVDVGTGEVLQVPSLVGLGYRGPWMHDGCAVTLKDRFTNTACGGGDLHGVTSQLSTAEVDDLVAYLQTL